MIYNVGDRVRCVQVYPLDKDVLNKNGVVVRVDGNPFNWIDEATYLVEFDEFIDGHSGGRRGKWGHCWCLSSYQLSPLNTLTPNKTLKKFHFI